jgi:hypothetical protein
MRATKLATVHALNMTQVRRGVMHGNEAEMGASEGRNGLGDGLQFGW